MGPCGVIDMLVAGSAIFEPAPIIVHGRWREPGLVANADDPMTATLREVTPLLMALPRVVAVGEGRCGGAPCIKVYVVEKTAELAARINDIAGGAPLDIVETGEFRARQKHD